MSELEKLLDAHQFASEEARDAYAYAGSAEEYAEVTERRYASRAAIIAHVAELRERAEKAEAKLERVLDAIHQKWCTCDSHSLCARCEVIEALGEP